MLNAKPPQVQLLHHLDDAEFVDMRLSGHRFPLHFHDTFVIQLVKDGTDWCCGNDLTAGKNEVFIHSPGAPHTGGTANSEGLTYQAIYPSKRLFHELTGADITDLATSPATWVMNKPDIVKRVRSLFHDCETKNTVANSAPPRQAGLRMRSGLRNVFESLLDERTASSETVGSQKPIFETMLTARQYLVDHFDQDVTTEELSAVCGVSAFHLIRSFKNHFGITPRQFLISQRVAKAKRLLATGMQVAAAAQACGFSDQSHLCRYFKKVTGYTPSRMQG